MSFVLTQCTPDPGLTIREVGGMLKRKPDCEEGPEVVASLTCSPYNSAMKASPEKC